MTENTKSSKTAAQTASAHATQGWGRITSPADVEAFIAHRASKLRGNPKLASKIAQALNAAASVGVQAPTGAPYWTGADVQDRYGKLLG